MNLAIRDALLTGTESKIVDKCRQETTDYGNAQDSSALDETEEVRFDVLDNSVLE